MGEETRRQIGVWLEYRDRQTEAQERIVELERKECEARQLAERLQCRIELLEAVRNAAAVRVYECDCQGRDVKLDADTTIHLVMEGCSHDVALEEALYAAFVADYEAALAARADAGQPEAKEGSERG